MGVRVLQTVMGLVFLFRAFTELPFADYLYGASGISEDIAYDRVYGPFLGGILNSFFGWDYGIHLLLLTLAFCGISYIVGFKTRLITLVSLFTFNLISSRNVEIGDGGDNITQLVLIYMLLLIPLDKAFEKGSLKVWVHNIGIAAIAAQIMVLYFTAGFMKINGKVWVEGIALFNVSQVETFSLPLMRGMFKNPYITTMASYMTMVFLIWFPLAMFSRLKLVWIAMGISFHMGILGMMGLVTFASTMIGLELFFISDAEYKKIVEYGKALFDMSFVRRVTDGIRSRFVSSSGSDAYPAEQL
jgi:hypothetical protein